MLFRNQTPFPASAFFSRDVVGMDFGVAAARGSFSIVPDRPLLLSREQEPLVGMSQYFGLPGESALQTDSSFAPFKPRTDIHVEATARAPGGEPAESWKIAIRVGKLSRELVVTGPRDWRYWPDKGWIPEDPEPISELPVRYEYAFGGSFQHDDEYCAFDENPVGTGYTAGIEPDLSRRITAPQIISPDDTEMEFGKIRKPEGLGPVSPAWQPRKRNAGTYGDDWIKTRWPMLPKDFSNDFHNSAHPDMIYPGYARGDEEIELLNLCDIPTLRTRLPNYRLGVLARYADGRVLLFPMALDTIHIDAGAMKAYLTWRGVFFIGSSIRCLETRMDKMKGLENGRS